LELRWLEQTHLTLTRTDMKDFFGTDLAEGDIVVQVDIGYTALQYARITSIGKTTLVTRVCAPEGEISRRWRWRYPNSVIKKPTA
jgi:hypothetical protein